MNAFKPRILVFAGSTRTESYNKKLARIVADSLRAAGAEVTHIDLRDFPMPLYDGDLEERSGLPEQSKRFKSLLVSNHGFFISSPEYNSSIPGVLKNAIDWASRPEEGEPPLIAFDGKVGALVSASPGGLGGLRALVHERAMFGNIGVLMLPEQLSVSRAHEAFNEDGSLKNPKQKAQVDELAADLVKLATKIFRDQ